MPKSKSSIVSQVTYIFKRDHRNGASSKSQWTISKCDEHESFQLARSRDWCGLGLGWSLHLAGAKAQCLGAGARAKGRHDVQLFIARFVSGTVNDWHGYPADPQIHNQDIPPAALLERWAEAALITPVMMRRTLRGQKCQL